MHVAISIPHFLLQLHTRPVIQEWLDEDKKHWRKQHHTAQRIYERLVEEQGYTGSYSVVQRYLKKCRSVQTEKANLELVWDPGPAQVDFGEADFYESGKQIRKKYLTLSFPYSNDGYSQVFGGETAECVCQGLVSLCSLEVYLHCLSLIMLLVLDAGSVM